MISLLPYVLILLVVSIVSMTFILRVLVKQVRLFKYPITDNHVSHFRKALFAISLTIIIMGLIPIAINLYTVFFATSRPATVSTISLLYSLSVHLQTLFLSYLLWRIYRLANDDFDDK